MSLRSCFTSCSTIFSSLFVVIVILERSFCSVDPTVILSMLKFRALNRLVTLKRTPGLFSTSADTMYHVPVVSVAAVVAVNFASLLLSCPLGQFLEQQMGKHPPLDQSGYR